MLSVTIKPYDSYVLYVTLCFLCLATFIACFRFAIQVFLWWLELSHFSQSWALHYPSFKLYSCLKYFNFNLDQVFLTQGR